MEKSKLGIHVLLLAAAGWLLGMYAGYTVVLLFAGYVLLVEENAWLKKQTVRVLATMVAFSVLSTVLHLIPNFMNLLNSFAQLGEEYIHWNMLDKIIYILDELLYWVKMVVYLLSGFLALNGKTFRLPLIDAFLDRYAV